MECALPPSLPPPPHTHSPKQSKSVLHCEMSHAIRITRLPDSSSSLERAGGRGARGVAPNQYTKDPLPGSIKFLPATIHKNGDKTRRQDSYHATYYCFTNALPMYATPLSRKAVVSAAPPAAPRPAPLSPFYGSRSMCSSAPEGLRINRICIH